MLIAFILAATLSFAQAIDCTNTDGGTINAAACTCPVFDGYSSAEATIANAQTAECTAITGLFCRKGLVYTTKGTSSDGHQNALCGAAALDPVHCPDQTGQATNAKSCSCLGSLLGTNLDCDAADYCMGSDKTDPLGTTDNARCAATVFPTDCANTDGQTVNDIPCICPITDDSTLASAETEDCTASTGLFCRMGLTYTARGTALNGHQNALCGASALDPVHCPDQTGQVLNTKACECLGSLIGGTNLDCGADKYCLGSERTDLFGNSDNARCSDSTMSAAPAQQLPFAAAVFGTAVMAMYQAM